MVWAGSENNVILDVNRAQYDMSTLIWTLSLKEPLGLSSFVWTTYIKVVTVGSCSYNSSYFLVESCFQAKCIVHCQQMEHWQVERNVVH